MGEETLNFDVVVVGAGPAGLAFAIRYAQLCIEAKIEPAICVLEKGASVGAHILSGAVFEPTALKELIPDYANLGAPLTTPVTNDEFVFLTQNSAWRLPTPLTMHNKGNFIISLGALCKWLASIAENLGVNIFPSFPAAKILFKKEGENEIVCGVETAPVGIDKRGNHKRNYQPGIKIFAKQVILAEGCRGELSQKIIQQYQLAKDSMPQTYGIGIKEIWEISEKQHQPGLVTHTIGWPLTNSTYGGSFLYHMKPNKLLIGFVIGLDYENTYLNPYEEFQRFKHHPKIRKILEGGRCISYGARALNEGGFQSIPKLTFPGGMLIGCSAGFLNVAKIKGSHTAMKSGMLAAEAVMEMLTKKDSGSDAKNEVTEYTTKIKNSWIWKELKQVRNIRPAFKWGLWPALIYSGIDQYILKGHAPWTFSHSIDNLSLKLAKDCKKIEYPKPDGKLSFDKMTSVSRSNTFHEEDQPCHLILKNPSIAIDINYKQYDSPETRYCPAGVYEIIQSDTSSPHLQINAANCVHCKTCDIKDPTQNIVWVAPMGGGGPNYTDM